MTNALTRQPAARASLALLLLAWAPARPGVGQELATPPFEGAARTAVDAQRRIVVLLDVADRPDEQHRTDLLARAWTQRIERDEALRSLRGHLLGGPTPPNEEARSRDLAAFASLLTDGERLHDGDRLLFRGLVDDLLAELESDRPRDARAIDALRATAARLTSLHGRFEREVTDRTGSTGRMEAPSDDRREWSRYLRFARRTTGLTGVGAIRRRTTDPGPTATWAFSPDSPRTTGFEVPAGHVLLTFDDGPHPRRTPAILRILADHGVQACFFQVGQRLGSVGPDGHAKPGAGARITRSILAAGHSIGNHSYSHPDLRRLEEEPLLKELTWTRRILEAIADRPVRLFRPPYGAVDADVNQALGELGFASVHWNVDSRDWADPIAASLARTVLDEVERLNGGIVLLHDIHPQTVEALPIILEGLREGGFTVELLVEPPASDEPSAPVDLGGGG